MPIIEIKRWDNDAVIWSGEAETIRQAVEFAVKDRKSLCRASLDGASLVGASLDGASLDRARLVGASLDGARLDGASLDRARLDGASLDGARLDGASLDRARLDGASLVGAILDGANLVGARLDGAILDGAILDGASLDGAILDGASLDGAILDGAILDGASLDGASLDRARLDTIKEDLFAVLDKAPAEVPGLLAAIKEGRIDGSCYQGDCCCLVGTIASVRGCSYMGVDGVLPDSSRPAERWFMALAPGHTPENHPVAEITAKWIEEWQAKHAVDS